MNSRVSLILLQAGSLFEWKKNQLLAMPIVAISKLVKKTNLNLIPTLII
jgi:hypothetical protein